MSRFFILVGWILALGTTTIAIGLKNDANPSFIFFNGKEYDSQSVYHLNNALNILRNPSFNGNLPTVLYIHGHNEPASGGSVEVIVNAYLTRGGYNVIVLNWLGVAKNPYPIAVSKVPKLASKLASVLNNMVSAGLPISRLHLVGHSIGAHLAGHIGRNIQTMTDHDLIIPRITALDPAGMLYYPEFLTKHIRASDAIFVDVIHTDVWNMGTVKPTGTVDFYPNSGWPPQPGCHSNKLHLEKCSHNRSWQLWAESVTSKSLTTFLAAPGHSWSEFEKGKTNIRLAIHMGIDCQQTVSGNYYLQTNGASPFSRGEAGLHVVKQ